MVALAVSVTAATGMAAGRPDLVVRSVSNPPAALAPGAGFRATDTVRNAGGGAAKRSAVEYFLSKNAKWDARDLRVGSHQFKRWQRRRRLVAVRGCACRAGPRPAATC